MRHPIEATVDALIADLRAVRDETPLPANGPVFLPGLWGSHDTEEGAFEGRYIAGDGALLRLALSIRTPGRWCSLALALGPAPLEEGAIVMLVADLQASMPVMVTLDLRSVVEGAHRDLAFDDRLEPTPEGGVQVAMLTVPGGSVLTEPADQRLLLLGLPQTDVEITLRDLRLFVLPAAAAATPPPPVEMPPQEV